MHSVLSRANPACGPQVDGKFLSADGRRFVVRGVSYGTFAPDAAGTQFPPAPQVARDFSLMVGAGFNTVRTYTAPPPWLLDEAKRQGLRVMIGLAWPQHLPFLDDRRLVRRIREEAADTVRRLGPHPATLLFALGNEIPAGIVRWHGPQRIERFLRRLYEEAKAAAPKAILSYVNFPPTEFLDLDCFDLCAFNVYLHREAELREYLARLQHIAGSKPFLLAEAGADSVREGLDGQARITAMHLRLALEEGACGGVAYTWTDEWWRGGRHVDDWAFGLVDRERRPKPALAEVSRLFAPPASAGAPTLAGGTASSRPPVSVVVCAHNAADTIGESLASLAELRYPNVEVIVVNDGSTDGTGELARRHPGVRVLDIPGGGLGAARNAGLVAATGEIVAFTDADCRVDPDWLTYLVRPLVASDVVGVGGPNVVPPDDPWVAQCVARAPGGPTHVMLDDRIAEHVPGCNMAFRRDVLLAVDGFNPAYVRAGDDVDICWRLQARKLQIGFAPSALVWHHHRASVRAYWRQQVGYGEGESWLDAHHPEKFLAGRMVWRGRIYSPLPFMRRTAERRVNSGVWGTAAFPSVYTTRPGYWHLLPHSPAWMAASFALLLVGVFGPLTGMEAAWLPLVVGSAGVLTTVVRCAIFGWRSDLRGLPRIGRWSRHQSRLLYRLLIGWLHLLQPLARFRGRIRGLLHPARITPQHVTRHPWKAPVPALSDALGSVRLLGRRGRDLSYWSESWTPRTSLLTELAGVLRASRPARLVDVDEGWRSDRDLSFAVGRWGWLHLQTLVEEHEGGRCRLRVRARLRPSLAGALIAIALALLMAGGTAASMALYTPSVGILVLAAAIAAIGARAAWRVMRASAVLDQAVTRVAAAAGFRRLPIEAAAEAAPAAPIRHAGERGAAVADPREVGTAP